MEKRKIIHKTKKGVRCNKGEEIEKKRKKNEKSKKRQLKVSHRYRGSTPVVLAGVINTGKSGEKKIRQLTAIMYNVANALGHGWQKCPQICQSSFPSRNMACLLDVQQVLFGL